jgi:hypothetical protein
VKQICDVGVPKGKEMAQLILCKHKAVNAPRRPAFLEGRNNSYRCKMIKIKIYIIGVNALIMCSLVFISVA